MNNKINTLVVRVSAAVLTTLGAIAFGGAVQAAPAQETAGVQSAAGCAEIQQRIESLEARERALQARLRTAPAWEKPAIVQMIVEVQVRLGVLYAELDNCFA